MIDAMESAVAGDVRSTQRKLNMARKMGKFAKPSFNQAAKVIAKFGGEVAAAELLGMSRITMYKWQYARPYGTDGLVPSSKIDHVKRVARLQGILLTENDWLPERIYYGEENGTDQT